MRMVFSHPGATRLMDDLATDVGSLVESLFGDAAERLSRPVSMSVPMDIDESEGAYVVTLDVPGISLESIEIEFHEDTLSIAGSRTAGEETAEEGDPAEVEASQTARLSPRRRERSFGSFERKVRLPVAVERDAVSAELSDGVLVITLPKTDPNKGKRRIPVSRS